MPQLTSTRVAGYRRSPKGRNDAQLFAQSRTLRIRQTVGLDLSIARSTSPLQPLAILLLSYFHKVSRAAGPTTTNLKLSEGGHWIASVVFGERDVKLSRSRLGGDLHNDLYSARIQPHDISSKRFWIADTLSGIDLLRFLSCRQPR